MTDAIVTAGDVAARALAELAPLTGPSITDRLNSDLADANFASCTYSKEFVSLLQIARNAAARQRSTQVKLHHIALALIWHPNAGKELADLLDSDAESIAVGCTIAPLTLGVLSGSAAQIGHAVGAVRWIGAAGNIARNRRDDAELQPSDLIKVLRSKVAHPEIAATLMKAARNGLERRDFILGPRPSESKPIQDAYADPIMFIDLVDKRQASNLLTGMERVQQQLELIDHRVSAINDALPRPPSALQLSAVVLSVLALGVAAGLVLSNAPALLMSQASSSSTR